MGFNDIVWSMFQGAKAARESMCPYKALEKSWYLYGIDDLMEMAVNAKTKDQMNIILEHMYHYDATQVDYYKQIENKIIERMW